MADGGRAEGDVPTPAPPRRGAEPGGAPLPPTPPEKWTPRVEGEEGDPTAFDFVFGGVIVAVVVVAILWATGVAGF